MAENELNQIWENEEKRLASLTNGVRKYRVWTYDTWGNEEDGYTVNDRREVGSVELSKDAPEHEILEAVSNWFDIERITVDDGVSDENTIELILEESGDQPVGQLTADDDPIPDISDFISEDVLEIKREQYFSDGKWITSFYTLVTGTGGPHVEFDTNYHINVYWGGERKEFTTYDDDARASIDQIEDYLKEMESD